MIASTSSMVSVGRPIIKYNFKLGIPFATSASAAVKIASSVIPLLMTLRMRSDPASGASVAVFTLLCARADSSSVDILSARSELKDSRTSSFAYCLHKSPMPGRSETAEPTRPMRRVRRIP